MTEADLGALRGGASPETLVAGGRRDRGDRDAHWRRAALADLFICGVRLRQRSGAAGGYLRRRRLSQLLNGRRNVLRHWEFGHRVGGLHARRSRRQVENPKCHLAWTTLAGIRRVESATELIGAPRCAQWGCKLIQGVRLDGTSSTIWTEDGGRPGR